MKQISEGEINNAAGNYVASQKISDANYLAVRSYKAGFEHAQSLLSSPVIKEEGEKGQSSDANDFAAWAQLESWFYSPKNDDWFKIDSDERRSKSDLYKIFKNK